MAATFAYLIDVRPYKNAWRVQVKILHSWKQYTSNTGETIELVISDEHGKKMHATVKKELVSKFVHKLIVDEWVFIEIFGLTYASGQFRPTNHLYKMAFQVRTEVMGCASVSDSNFLTLAPFSKIQSGELNPHMLVDAIGQIIIVGELEELEANNKRTTKIDFEIRDQMDERMQVTLWGTYAQEVYRACQESEGKNVIFLIRFAKIKSYKGIFSFYITCPFLSILHDLWPLKCYETASVKSLSNSFDASQVHVNPDFPEVHHFSQTLPNDGAICVFRARVPRFEMVVVKRTDYSEYTRNTIEDLLSSTEVGKVRVLCTIYAVDTDWAWYYISCKTCNKKVNHIHAGVNGVNNKGKKPKFWCDTCKSVVTNVVSRYMIYAKVMDNTGEAKLLMFDSICSEIIGESPASVLNGSVDEPFTLFQIDDPEDLPDSVKNLIGKTFLFLVCVEKDNILDGKEIYKVSKVLLKDGLIEEQLLEDSAEHVNPASIVSGD
ncbi:putative nucleic acid-binding, replication factor A [Arabidopsis thaliana]